MPHEQFQQERATLSDQDHQDRQIARLVVAHDNLRDFNEAVETVDDTHLAEVLAVNFLRPSYMNGSSPPYVIFKEEPLYDRVVAADPSKIGDPIRQSVVSGMQQLLTAENYGSVVHTKNFEQDAEQRMLAFTLVPDMIKKYPLKVTQAIYRTVAHELNQPSSSKSDNVKNKAQLIYDQAVDALVDKCLEPTDPATSITTEDALDRLMLLDSASSILSYQRASEEDEHNEQAQAKLQKATQKILGEELGLQGAQLQTINTLLVDNVRRDAMLQNPDMFDSVVAQAANPVFQRLVNGEEFQKLEHLKQHAKTYNNLREYAIDTVINARLKAEPEHDNTSSYIGDLWQAMEDPEFMDLLADPSRDFTSVLINTPNSISPLEALKTVRDTYNDPLVAGIIQNLKKFEDPKSGINPPMEQFEAELMIELRMGSYSKKRFTTLLHDFADNPRLSKLIEEPSSALVSFVSVLVHKPSILEPKEIIKAGSGIIAEAYAQASKQTDLSKVEQYTAAIRSFCTDLDNICRIGAGVGNIYLKFLEDKQDMSGKDQLKSAKLFRAMFILGLDGLSEIKSLDQLEATVVDGFIEQLTGEGDILSSKEKERLVGSFGGLTPLITYAHNFIGNLDHKTAIAELAVTVADGTYGQWRRGDGSQETMQQMVDKGYLPEKLTHKQYQEWITDRSGNSREQLVNSAKDTAREIRNVLQHAAIDFNDFLPEYAEYDMFPEGIPVITERRNQLGQLLGAINKVAKDGEEALTADELLQVVESINSIPDLNQSGENPDVTEALDMLENGVLPKDLREQLKQRRQQLEYKQLLIRLANISPEEVAEGAFLKGEDKDGSAKAQYKLIDVLRDMEDNLPEDLQFIAYSVVGLLYDYESSSDHIEELSVEDTIDPKVTLEIGVTPQKTCQNYDGGHLSKGLIGYFGPEVKILTVKNSKGGIVARSILRLMQDVEGQPVLYTEPVYSAISGTQVKTMIRDHVEQKAKAMGVETRGALSGMKTQKNLRVRNLKMPVTYSDGGNGLNSGSLAIRTS